MYLLCINQKNNYTWINLELVKVSHHKSTWQNCNKNYFWRDAAAQNKKKQNQTNKNHLICFSLLYPDTDLLT